MQTQLWFAVLARLGTVSKALLLQYTLCAGERLVCGHGCIC